MPPSVEGNPMSSLYVGDLHLDVNEAMLFEKFSPAGPIVSIRVCRDKMTHRSLGYSYVNFQQYADAKRTLATFSFTVINGQPVQIMWFQIDPSLRKSGIGNIFIKNLAKSIDRAALYDTFSAFGNILSCKVETDDYGSKGYGFVHYETLKSHEDAQRAVHKMNAKCINGRQVYVGRAQNKQERQAELKCKFEKINQDYQAQMVFFPSSQFTQLHPSPHWIQQNVQQQYETERTQN